MKKQILTTLLLFSLSLAKGQAPVQIKGTFNKKHIKPVKLYQMVEGDLEEIATSQPLADGRFGFTFYPPYEGFYIMGSGDKNAQADHIVLYAKPGYQLELNMTDKNYQLVGLHNSKENQILAKWAKEINTVKQKSFNWMKNVSTYVDFFPDLEVAIKKGDSFVRNNKSRNPEFDRKMQEYIRWDLAANASNFLSTPRSAHPKNEELLAYYTSLSAGDFGNHAALAYQMPWGKRTLNSITTAVRIVNHLPYEGGLKGLKMEMDLIPNDTLKGDVLLNYLVKQKDYKRYSEAIDLNGRYLLTKNQQKRAMNVMNDLAQLKPGDQGLDFEFPDQSGKKVKFSDYKGKVVLMDVWATWCAPCKQEIPHLQKLIEEMHGTDIQIVSVSLDEAKDKQKWLSMVEHEKLKGKQLFASGWGDFAAYYKITGIPRFMVFDKQGRIVSLDSPRPSDPELKKLLSKVLAQ